MSDLNGLFRLNESHIKPAAEVLARAFYNDPWFAYIIPDTAEREKKLQALFQVNLCSNILHGEVYAPSPNLEGITTWLPPEAADRIFWETPKSDDSELIAEIGKDVIDALQTWYDYFGPLHKQYTPFPHWFLDDLAVDPPFQGKGYAGAMLRAMFARLDKENIPCYLRTQNGRNVSFYQHFGFRVVDEGEIPGTGIGNWCLLRGGGG